MLILISLSLFEQYLITMRIQKAHFEELKQ